MGSGGAKTWRKHHLGVIACRRQVVVMVMKVSWPEKNREEVSFDSVGVIPKSVGVSIEHLKHTESQQRGAIGGGGLRVSSSIYLSA